MDARPLRDKPFQSTIQQEIYDYLITHKFELEMNHSITLRSLKQPTQKDFILIFRFLYNKIDPYYDFQRLIELEIYSILKSLDYPYLETVNRSQISAVGGQNWPSFLGVLHWLIKVNQNVESVDKLNENEFISPDDEFDKIFIEYIRDSYNEFINEKDDYSEFFEKLQVDFNRLSGKMSQEIEKLQTETTALTAQFTELESQLEELNAAEKKSHALDEDLVKFQAYVETMQSRRDDWAKTLNTVKLEIETKEEESKLLNEKVKELENEIISKGMSIQEIDSLNQTRDSLSKSIDSHNIVFEDLEKTLENKTSELVLNRQSLENFVKTYNTMVAKFQGDFEISLVNDERIINKLLKDEKISLLTYRNQVNSLLHQNEDERIKLQESCDEKAENVMEKNELFDTFSNKLNSLKLEYDELYEGMLNDGSACALQMEKLDKDLKKIKIATNQGFIELENNYLNKVWEEKETGHRVGLDRKGLLERCQRVAETVMGFKLRVGSGLLELDDLVELLHNDIV